MNTSKREDWVDILRHAGIVIRRGMDQGRTRADMLEEVGDVIRGGDTDPGRGAARTVLAAFGPSAAQAWLESGFATIEVGHKLCASLMCTSITADSVVDVAPPWKCFMVRVPAGVIGRATDMLCHWDRFGLITVIMLSDAHVSIGQERDLGDWANLRSVERIGDAAFDWDTAERGTLLCGRLLAGVCVEMQTPMASGTVRGSRTEPRFDHRTGSPLSWVFKLSRSVKVDVREAVRQYASGERSGKLSLQHLVRGHHKRQSYGLGGSARKWVHIEPYWRGDRDAPIALRSHKIETATRVGDQ